ncbi:Tad domain-containing protein [Lysobacter sp. SG-8]|uniref:Tad domain-containing protein n=1 Tax=Marilutibacter penaei TaxID=2759900 RepID=A0A7W3U4C2_9GAMM|nr:Tad domain-containing protein [Lysobacter penaei]MBB1088706.1 Tad domain-containing protein [Lysobacter penaei]
MHKHRGQAMVLFLVLVGILCLGAILMFNTGQAVNKKVSLTHTADAAAYSVAVQQARAMNFAAYMNRARVANEVAIAQLVSMWSWMNMFHSHAVIGHNLMTYLSFVPYINIVARPMAQVYKQVERVIGRARDAYHPFANGVIGAVDGVNGILATAASATLRFGGGSNGFMIAREVVEKNDPTARIAPLGHALLLKQLLEASALPGGKLFDEHRARSPNPGMDRYRNVVMASRDRFTADRNDFLGIDFSVVKIGFNEAGGTDMVQYNRWVAADGLDFTAEIDLGLFDIDFDVPLGFGGAQALESRNRQPGFFQGGCPNNRNGGICAGGRNRRGKGWYSDYHPGERTYKQYNGAGDTFGGRRGLIDRYPSVNAPASVPFFTPMRPTGQRNRKRDAYFSGYQGLRDYHDVKQDVVDSSSEEHPGPTFTVLVESERQAARTSEDIDGIGGPEGGQLELDNAMRGDKLTAIASAQTYFVRPFDPASSTARWFMRKVPRQWGGEPQAVNELEKGSVFSPYWQARLVETPKEDYIAAGLDALISGG